MRARDRLGEACVELAARCSTTSTSRSGRLKARNVTAVAKPEARELGAQIGERRPQAFRRRVHTFTVGELKPSTGSKPGTLCTPSIERRTR